jgi:hypothetical protein
MAAKSRMKPMMSPRDGCLHTVHSAITVYCPLLGQCFKISNLPPHSAILCNWDMTMLIFFPFSIFLFYCRFAEISKLPDNNTNIALYHMYSLRCSGTENIIENCSYSWGLRTCTDKSTIHISCSKLVTNSCLI